MKIFYITECSECRNCLKWPKSSAGICIKREKTIEDTGTIPDWCLLEDATEYIKWKKEHESST